MLSSPGLFIFPRSQTTFICLSPLGDSSLGGDRASDSKLVISCRFLWRASMSSNGRSTSRSRRRRKDRRQAAVRNVPRRTLLALTENLNDSEVVLKYGGQVQQTARECAGAVVRGHELCIVPDVSRGSAESYHLQSRRDCRLFFQTAGNDGGSRCCAARNGSLP